MAQAQISVSLEVEVSEIWVILQAHRLHSDIQFFKRRIVRLVGLLIGLFVLVQERIEGFEEEWKGRDFLWRIDDLIILFLGYC